MRSLALFSLLGLAAPALVGAHNVNSRSRAHMLHARQAASSASSSSSAGSSDTATPTDNIAVSVSATVSASVGGATPTGGAQEVEMVASTWYAGWHAADFPLDKVSWDKYTQVTYAFGCVVSLSHRKENVADGVLLPCFLPRAIYGR